MSIIWLFFTLFAQSLFNHKMCEAKKKKEETKNIQITIVKTLLMSNIINHFMHGRNYKIVNEVV